MLNNYRISKALTSTIYCRFMCDVVKELLVTAGVRMLHIQKGSRQTSMLVEKLLNMMEDHGEKIKTKKTEQAVFNTNRSTER